jgi:hypothetical protein
MIANIFHQGSGLGNQLHRYVMARVIALDRGYDFGVIFPENFKGHFMNIDMGVPVKGLLNEYKEKSEKFEGNEVRDYDWDIKDIEDFTLIDGEFQGEKYFEHRLDEIREWLKVEPLDVPDDLCIIGFRGGEYVGVRDLFLPQSYWDSAIKLMRDKYPNIRFEVHTDDVETAQKFFPFPCIHDIGLNWRSVRYAKHLIIANSSFYILPALLGNAKEIIAPKYWAGYNKGYWQLKQNKYERFAYIG